MLEGRGLPEKAIIGAYEVGDEMQRRSVATRNGDAYDEASRESRRRGGSAKRAGNNGRQAADGCTHPPHLRQAWGLQSQ